MVYITGDTHGDISWFKNPKLKKLGEKDILIICGDFGFLWNPNSETEKKNLEILKSKKSQKQIGNFENLGELRNILKGKTVLLADDDVRNIFSLTKALEVHGMKVLPAMDGKEALKILKEDDTIDIVLMDMMMPEMDGYETIREIRISPQFRNLPVLAVTSKAMMGDREKCIAVGASDYISKPVDIDQLVSLLRVWLYDII